MNARAYGLVAIMRGVLDDLPASTAISFHARKAWALFLITASSDEAVFALGKELELEEAEVGRGAGRWWRRATSENKQGTLRIVVTGPRHKGEPPPDDSRDRSV